MDPRLAQVKKATVDDCDDNGKNDIKFFKLEVSSPLPLVVLPFTAQTQNLEKPGTLFAKGSVAVSGVVNLKRLSRLNHLVQHNKEPHRKVLRSNLP